MQKCYIHPLTFGLKLGAVFVAIYLVLALSTLLLGPTVGANMHQYAFMPYNVSFVGSILLSVLAFVNGLITGILIAFLYNFFVKRNPSQTDD